MARPEMPFFVGATRPSAVGWTRVLLTVVIGGVVIALMSQRPDLATPATITLVAVLFLGMTVWTFIHQWTRFVVDERGVTVSLGGFWPRQGWPLADFRTVQLRDLGDVTVSAAVGGLGLAQRPGAHGLGRAAATRRQPQDPHPRRAAGALPHPGHPHRDAGGDHRPRRCSLPALPHGHRGDGRGHRPGDPRAALSAIG